MSELIRRRAYTDDLMTRFESHIQSAQDLASEGQACVCATGSIGRREAGKYSDLDLVIVTRGAKKSPIMMVQKSRRMSLAYHYLTRYD